MSKYSLETRSRFIKKEGLTLEKFREELRSLCNDDFNCSNGEDYYVERKDSNGNLIKLSQFDDEWLNNVDVGDNLSSAAREILLSNFESDRNYYVDYNLVVEDTDDSIIIFTAAMVYV